MQLNESYSGCMSLFLNSFKVMQKIEKISMAIFFSSALFNEQSDS
jgi:hypothetical protein